MIRRNNWDNIRFSIYGSVFVCFSVEVNSKARNECQRFFRVYYYAFDLAIFCRLSYPSSDAEVSVKPGV